MAYYTYPVYVLASLIVLILCIIIFIYLLHFYNFLKSRVCFIRVSNEQFETEILSSATAIADTPPFTSNRMCRCFGYVMMLLPSNIRQTSMVLLCRCKMVKFKRIFLDTIGSRYNLEIINKEESADELNDTIESQVSIFSIDNSLESDYVIVPRETSEQQKPSDDPFNSSCPICLDDFELDEEILLLVCHHGFHKDCLSNSLRLSASCPLCKSKSNMKTFKVGEQLPLLWRTLRSGGYGSHV